MYNVLASWQMAQPALTRLLIRILEEVGTSLPTFAPKGMRFQEAEWPWAHAVRAGTVRALLPLSLLGGQAGDARRRAGT